MSRKKPWLRPRSRCTRKPAPSSVTTWGSGTLPAISRVSARASWRYWKTQFKGASGLSCAQRADRAACSVASSASEAGRNWSPATRAGRRPASIARSPGAGRPGRGRCVGHLWRGHRGNGIEQGLHGRRGAGKRPVYQTPGG
jgi:hypothetical protein